MSYRKAIIKDPMANFSIPEHKRELAIPRYKSLASCNTYYMMARLLRMKMTIGFCSRKDQLYCHTVMYYKDARSKSRMEILRMRWLRNVYKGGIM